MRMYHGPAYANPYGRLYPQRTYNHQPLPVGVPHPANNPWYYGFANGQAQQPVAAPQMAPVPHGPPVNPPMTPAPPAPAPVPPGAQQWFQGYGAAVVGGGYGDASPSASAAERKKTKAATVNPAAPMDFPVPPSKPSSYKANDSAGSKSRRDTQTLWRDGRHKSSNSADGRGDETWGAHDSKGIDNFLERLSAKYSNSPKSNKSRSPDKGGSQKAGSNGWGGTGTQNNTGDWNNDNHDATNQWDNTPGNENPTWNNDNSNDNNDANNQWDNNNGNDVSNSNQGDHTTANAGDWSAPNNFGGGDTSNGNWNGGAGSQTGSNKQWNSGESAGNNWGASERKRGDNDNSNNVNWGDGSNTGQTGTDWANTANDQANNHVAGNWDGNNRSGSEHGSNRSAKSNTHQPTNRATPPGSWPDDNKPAQASPQGSPPRDHVPSTGGNVVGSSDEWGDTKNKGGGGSWQDTGAAQSTNYWDNEGKGTEQDTTGPGTGGQGPWWE